VPDPCGNHDGYKRIVACFLEQLMHDHNSRSATVCGYAQAINILFELRKYKIPADLSSHTNMCYNLILAREREENVARQRSPITREMFTVLLERAKTSQIESDVAVVAQWFIMIRITGFRCSEYAQTRQSAFDEYEYPSGRRWIGIFMMLGID